MAKNYYPEEFRRKAVDLYESTPEQTMQRGLTAFSSLSAGLLTCRYVATGEPVCGDGSTTAVTP